MHPQRKATARIGEGGSRGGGSEVSLDEGGEGEEQGAASKRCRRSHDDDRDDGDDGDDGDDDDDDDDDHDTKSRDSGTAKGRKIDETEIYFSLVSLYATCLRTVGSNFMISNFSGFVRLFLVVV